MKWCGNMLKIKMLRDILKKESIYYYYLNFYG